MRTQACFRKNRDPTKTPPPPAPPPQPRGRVAKRNNAARAARKFSRERLLHLARIFKECSRSPHKGTRRRSADIMPSAISSAAYPSVRYTSYVALQGLRRDTQTAIRICGDAGGGGKGISVRVPARRIPRIENRVHSCGRRDEGGRRMKRRASSNKSRPISDAAASRLMISRRSQFRDRNR